MGARGVTQLDSLRAHFDKVAVLMPTSRTYADAGALNAGCRWASITPRSPHECLIAQSAIEHGVALLHDDRDFELIARVEPALRLLRG